MDLIYTICLILWFVLALLFLLHRLLGRIVRKAVNNIDEYASLVKLDALQQRILHQINISNSSLADIKNLYSRLTEAELKDFLDKYCQLKVLELVEVRYFLNLNNYYKLCLCNLPEVDKHILTSFFNGYGDNSYTYRQLLQMYTRPTQEDIVNALKSLCNIGSVKINQDATYYLDMRVITNSIKIHRRIIENQNNE